MHSLTYSMPSANAAKEMRRTGLGRRMLAHLLSDCSGSGIAAIFIEVAEADAGAVAFYDATGFRVCGRRRAYYRDRPPGANDALLMRLDIAAADAP